MVFKRKLVIFNSSPEPWAERQPKLEKKTGFSKLAQHVTRSISQGTTLRVDSPPDTHMFYEIYEKNNRPNKIWYKLMGSAELPDFTEYKDDVTSVEFNGYIFNIKTAMEVTRRLVSCREVIFVLGEKEQRMLPGNLEEEKGLVDSNPALHVTSLEIKFPSRSESGDSKNFVAFVQIQVKTILRQAICNYPNLEKVTLNDVPYEEEIHQLLRRYLHEWENLKFNYDVRVMNNTILLAETSEKIPSQQKKQISARLESIVPKAVPVSDVTIVNKQKPDNKSNNSDAPPYCPLPIIIPLEKTAAVVQKSILKKTTKQVELVTDTIQSSENESHFGDDEEMDLEKTSCHSTLAKVDPIKSHAHRTHHYDGDRKRKHTSHRHQPRKPTRRSRDYKIHSSYEHQDHAPKKRFRMASDDPQHCDNRRNYSAVPYDYGNKSHSRRRSSYIRMSRLDEEKKNTTPAPAIDEWDTDEDQEQHPNYHDGKTEGHGDGYDSSGYNNNHFNEDYEDNEEVRNDDIKPDIKPLPLVCTNLTNPPWTNHRWQEFLSTFSRRDSTDHKAEYIAEEIVIPVDAFGNILFHQVTRRSLDPTQAQVEKMNKFID